MALLLLLFAGARAAEPDSLQYVVAQVLELSPNGEWTAGPGRGEAFRVTEGGDIPLQAGESLGANDRVVTHQARVVLDGPEGFELTLYEDTDLVLADYGAWQRVGAVLYSVHGVFKVRYARFEALVEGTRFLVEGDALGHGSVAVSRGRVRVRSLQGEVRVRRGHLATLDPGRPPERRRWRPDGSRPPVALASSRRARVVVGADLRGRYGFGDQAARGASGELTGRLAVKLPGRLAAVAAVGVDTSGHQGHFPVGLGLESRWGPVTVGGSGQVSVGFVQDCATETVTPIVDGGGSVDVGLHLPVAPRIEVEGRLSGGWLYGPELKLGVGVGVAL